MSTVPAPAAVPVTLAPASTANTLSASDEHFIPGVVFAAAYFGALVMCIVRCLSRRSKTWILFFVFVHIVLRLSAFILWVLFAKNVVHDEAGNAIFNLWLPALPVFAMAHCIATAVYAAKGPWQERVRFGALPMSMRAAFIAPHGLLVLAALAGLYLPIVDAYKACDGMTMTVIMLDILACSWFAWARKYKKPPAYFLYGTGALMIIAGVYRMMRIGDGILYVFPTGIMPYLLECAPQALCALLFVIIKVKRLLGLGEHAGSPPFMLPMHADNGTLPPPAPSSVAKDGETQGSPVSTYGDSDTGHDTRSVAPTSRGHEGTMQRSPSSNDGMTMRTAKPATTVRDFDRSTMRTKGTTAW